MSNHRTSDTIALRRRLWTGDHRLEVGEEVVTIVRVENHCCLSAVTLNEGDELCSFDVKVIGKHRGTMRLVTTVIRGRWIGSKP